jgi:hypothetical protein
MTREDIIRMAREAGLFTHKNVQPEIERFANLVAAASEAKEREACAKLCDTTPPYPFRPSIEAAHAIRARGQA